jgi:Na+-transporting methylmalonyl-CoA/oxaloacetate decarboxylase beta subunit
MKFSEFFTSKDNIQLDKKTLVILRWIAIVGQFFTISLVYFFLGTKTKHKPLLQYLLPVGFGPSSKI